ncbi:MAG: FAD-dependent oxidoreductase [Rickettsiaceae bacterium]
MKLKFDLSFNILLSKPLSVSKKFSKFLKEYDEGLWNELEIFYRKHNNRFNGEIELNSSDYSYLIIRLAPVLEDFISQLFSIESEVYKLQKSHKEFDVIYQCNKKFIQRFVLVKYQKNSITDDEFKKCKIKLESLLNESFTQKSFAKQCLEWMCNRDQYITELDIAAKYARYILDNNASSQLDEKIIFYNLKKIDTKNLINQENINYNKLHNRLDFNYHAPKLNTNYSLFHSNYCLYCQERDKDFCRKGYEKFNSSGCPLNQKISEMNKVKSSGFNIGALAIIMIDNPMVPLTGYRICNDCSKACIYQNQEAVDIPLIESEVLQNVLNLPYGAEIYMLLAQWNPLNVLHPKTARIIEGNILVVGLGPAGIALSYYLLQYGKNVIAIDGSKINPISFDINQPIKTWKEYNKDLSDLIPDGFGGVAQYGITSRWNKNHLLLMRILLQRRGKNFKIYDGVYFGNTITSQQAYDIGFDHIAICTGIKKPQFLNIPNILSKGVRFASDFLMSLQSGGVFLKNSNTNLTIRMPVAIVGCGLTAVDASIEILKYYPIQVENFAKNYEKLSIKFDKATLERDWTEEDSVIAQEFLTHAQLFRSCSSDDEKLDIINNKLGGVTIYYRKSIEQSSAYKLNHEEIEHAMSFGVQFKSNIEISKIHCDKHSYIESIEFQNQIKARARCLLIAIGNDHQDLHDKQYTYFGDCDPNFTGSVVKALASVKYGYRKVLNKTSGMFPKYFGASEVHFALRSLLKRKITRVVNINEDVCSITVHAPILVNNFQVGQFFKLQNYPRDSFEPIALNVSYINFNSNSLVFIFKKSGLSTKIASQLTTKDNIYLMGPVGQPLIDLPKRSNVLVIAEDVYNINAVCILEKLKQNDCNILHVAYYSKATYLIYRHKIQALSDKVVWCSDSGFIKAKRKQDVVKVGALLDILKQLNAKSYFSHKKYHVLTFASSQTNHDIQTYVNELFSNSIKITSNANAPMHCMMNGICGQCVAIKDKNKNHVFNCICQYYDVNNIDFSSISKRLQQNSLQEKISSLLYEDKKYLVANK